MRLAALLLPLAVAAAGCKRDLALPESAPPRISAVQLAGLPAATAPSPLPVLGGELVAVDGSGFPASADQLAVRIGSDVAEVVDAAPGRLVLLVPFLAAAGAADLQITTPAGIATAPAALRYDGPGQPLGLGTSTLPSTTPIGFVAPVQGPWPSRPHYPPYVVAAGAGDSALLVAPLVNVAATTVPLGLVPTSIAARIVPDGANLELQVLAVSRGGDFSLGSALLDPFTAVVRSADARSLAHPFVQPLACSNTQLLFTDSRPPAFLGEIPPKAIPVVAWRSADGVQRVAALDEGELDAGRLTPRTPAASLPAELVSWSPWSVSSVVVAAGAELYVFDASALTTARLEVQRGPGRQAVTAVIEAACSGGGPITAIRGVAVGSANGSEVLAVAYFAGRLDRIALVDLDGPGAGRVRTGVLGNVPTAIALAPLPAYQSSPAEWAVFAAGISTMLRVTPAPGGPECAELVVDAGLSLSEEVGLLPAFGGLTMGAEGTRLVTTTPAGDLWTVLPPTLTSAGPVLRLASYAGLSLQRARIGEGEGVAVVAEHARYQRADLANLDTGSALLFVSLSGGRGSVALGGSGYGRGAVWLDPPTPGGGGGLAYTGDTPAAAGDPLSKSGGAAAVTGFQAGTCVDEEVRVTSSRPVANGPDLLAQGPARAGLLGPHGVARHGPAAAPVYAVKDTTLRVYAQDQATLACLGGNLASLDWAEDACRPESKVELGVQPLDVTFSAGDRAIAVRRLDPACITLCAPADLLCRRGACEPAKQLVVVPAATGVAAVVPLPAAPRAVAAHPGGGFLVTAACAPSFAAGDPCFPSSPICAGRVTGGGGADGALLLVTEDGATPACLAVLPGIGGPLAVTPNGAEAWVTANAFGDQVLSRLALPRRAADGAVDAGGTAERLSVEALGAQADAAGSFPPGGVAFSPDGATGIVTVPAEYRIALYE